MTDLPVAEQPTPNPEPPFRGSGGLRVRGSSPAREYVSVAEAAIMLGVSEKVIRADINRGRLPSYRVGRLIRIKLADLELLREPVR
jgi:excisionase family DNA binding protein